MNKLVEMESWRRQKALENNFLLLKGNYSREITAFKKGIV